MLIIEGRVMPLALGIIGHCLDAHAWFFKPLNDVCLMANVLLPPQTRR
jgi:hypothetical protein